MPTTLDQAQTRRRTLGEARLALLKERGFSLSTIARNLGRDFGCLSGQQREAAFEAD